MPQVQGTGAVTPGQNGAPQLYGTTAIENTIPFQERLLRRFSPTDFVLVKNVTDKPVYWQYLPEHAEKQEFTQDGMQKIITRQQPELWVIEAGQTEALIGASAIMCLDIMYKNYSADRILHKEGTEAKYDNDRNHLPKNFNFADGGAQEKFIEMAYLGKANPTFSVPQQEQPAIDQAPSAPAAPVAPVAPIESAEPAKPARELVNASSNTAKKAS